MIQDTNFDQFIDFIAHFSSELASGTSPEYALVRTSNYFGKQTPKEIMKALYDVVEGTKSFHDTWADLINAYSGTAYARLLELLRSFVEKGSIIGGERMLKVLKQVRRNSTITKNRENLVKSQKVKVMALSLVSSIVIGMIAALAPILTFAFYEGLFSNTALTYPAAIAVQIFVASLLTVVVTGYRLNQTVGGSRRIVLLCIISFSCTYVLIAHLLTTLI
jgi:hypothetical protein